MTRTGQRRGDLVGDLYDGRPAEVRHMKVVAPA